jgi:putative NIF3 family GTP cyclohydrolase 1 type 2
MANIPLKDYVDAKETGLLRLVGVTAVGLLILFFVGDLKDSKAVRIALDGTGEATKVAKAEAKDALLKHNGLIDRMRELSATYVTKGSVMSFLVAVGICVTIYFAFLRGAS